MDKRKQQAVMDSAVKGILASQVANNFDWANMAGTITTSAVSPAAYYTASNIT